MSDPRTAFNGSGELPKDVPPSAGPADGDGQNRALLVVVGVVVGLVVLAGLYALVVRPLFATSEQPESQQVMTPRPSGDIGAGDAPDVAQADDFVRSSGGTPVPETFEVFFSRDPFQQLIIEVPVGGTTDGDPDPTAAPAEVADADSVVDPTTPTVSTPTISSGGSGGEGPGGDGGDLSAAPTDQPTSSRAPGTSGQGAGGQGARGQAVDGPEGGAEYWERPGAGTIEVELVATTISDAGSDAVVILVDDVEHEVVEGEIFAERFWLLDIHEDCGTFLFGDSRFTLCVGETIFK